MKKYIWIFLLVAVACHQPAETTVRVHLKSECAGKPVELMTIDSVYKTVADSLAEAVFVLPQQFVPGYSTCYFEKNWIPVYTEPGKSFELISEGDSIYFTGAGGAVNNYLNSSFFRREQICYELEEKDFIESLKQRLATGNHILDTTVLEDSFKQTERKRLYYQVYGRLGNYPYLHARINQLTDYRVPDNFIAFYNSIAKEEDHLAEWEEYRRFFQGLVSISGEQGTRDRVQILQNRLNYIDRQIHGTRLAAYLTDLFMTDHLKNYGVDGWEDQVAFYDAKVSDTIKRAAFSKLYATWADLAKGQPSPAFQFPDINGKQIGLADLAGKYVYIDVWATWCYFCCKEFPALKMLEQEFASKNIHFVSISCDKDKTVWEKKVREEKLGGIQLNIEEDQDFMKSYIIQGIPRFILLDREGKILDANMTRPSDPETKKILRALPGI